MSDEHHEFRPPEERDPDAKPDPWGPPPDPGSGAVRILGPQGSSQGADQGPADQRAAGQGAAGQGAAGQGSSSPAAGQGSGTPSSTAPPTTAPSDEPPLRFKEDDTGPMPHWTDPPTGEVPRFGADPTRADADDDWGDAAGEPVWRSDREPIPGFEAVPDFGEHDRLGALAEPRGDPADPFFDDFEAVGEAEHEGEADRTGAGATPVTPISTRSTRPAGEPAGPTRVRRATMGRADGGTGRGVAGRDLPVAIGVGLAMAAVFVLLLIAGPKFAVGLVVVVVVAGAVEFFDGLRRVGYQPATLLGLAAVAGLPLAAYWRYESGVLLVLAIALVAALAWYVLADLEVKAVPNIAVTFLGIGYIGFLASFAALLLAIPDQGTGLLFGVVACTVAADIGALFVGSGVGGAPLAPSISPNKTVAGLIGGIVASIVVGIILSATLFPWSDKFVYGLQLGIVVGLAAALGDLVESRMKRDLGLKDFGTLLPGHGGVLDRCDAFLFTLPAVYYLVRILNLY